MDMVICMNCGQKGHKFRACPEPILSYGIACFIQNKQLKHPREDIESNTWLCLAIRRRHTYSYVDYLRGKYSISDVKYQRSLFSRMTKREQVIIGSKPFNTMWSNLWLENEYPSHQIISNKYKKNASNKHLNMLQIWFDKEHQCIAKSKWDEPEWGIPKGRRNSDESNRCVAMREFWEETGIEIKKVHIIPNTLIKEAYIANNGHRYCNQYFIATWNSDMPFDLTDIKPSHSSMYSFKAEIGDVQLLTKAEFLSKTRDYEMHKLDTIESCFSLLEHSKID